MNEYEFYMVDMIKAYADRIRNEDNKEIKWMLNNVAMELITSFVNFESFCNGIVPGDVMESDSLGQAV